VQFHGGIAITEDFWIHRWVRRVVRLAVFDGEPLEHYERVGRALRAGSRLEPTLN
jgi:alkylation response protein AidB-like acyl-CoA dehydrogenase